MAFLARRRIGGAAGLDRRLAPGKPPARRNIFDGWLPNAGCAAQWERQWAEIQKIARETGRDPDALTGAVYLTLSVDDDVARANQRLDSYLEQYYGQPAATLRARQECYAGPAAGLLAYLNGYAQAGAGHLILRFTGDHERHLEIVGCDQS